MHAPAIPVDTLLDNFRSIRIVFAVTKNPGLRFIDILQGHGFDNLVVIDPNAGAAAIQLQPGTVVITDEDTKSQLGQLVKLPPSGYSVTVLHRMDKADSLGLAYGHGLTVKIASGGPDEKLDSAARRLLNLLGDLYYSG